MQTLKCKVGAENVLVISYQAETGDFAAFVCSRAPTVPLLSNLALAWPGCPVINYNYSLLGLLNVASAVKCKRYGVSLAGSYLRPASGTAG